jgi:hypothetical protein
MLMTRKLRALEVVTDLSVERGLASGVEEISLLHYAVVDVEGFEAGKDGKQDGDQDTGVTDLDLPAEEVGAQHIYLMAESSMHLNCSIRRERALKGAGPAKCKGDPQTSGGIPERNMADRTYSSRISISHYPRCSASSHQGICMW